VASEWTTEDANSTTTPVTQVKDGAVRLEIPDGMTLCNVYAPGHTIHQEYQLLAQLDLAAGSLLLPGEAGTTAAELIEEIRLGPEQLTGTAEAPGQLASEETTSGVRYTYTQEVQVGEATVALTASFELEQEATGLIWDEAFMTNYLEGIEGRVELGDGESEDLLFTSCGYPHLPEWDIHLDYQDGVSVHLDLRQDQGATGAARANLVGAMIHSYTMFEEQDDYWSLVYAVEDGSESYWVLFDEPVDDIHGVWIDGDSSLAYLDAELQVLRQTELVASERRPAVPQPSQLHRQHFLIPAAAHTDGEAGTSWRTDVLLHSHVPAVSADTHVSFYLLPQAGAPVWSENGQRVVLPWGDSKLVEDVVRGTFAQLDATGALLVGLQGGVVVSSRTYNDTGAGTYGQYIRPVRITEAMGAGDQAVLIQLSSNQQYRTNIGIAHIGLGQSQVRYQIDLYDETGALLGSRSVDLSEEQPYHQENRVFTRVTPDQVEDGYAIVHSDDPEAYFVAYGSVVDESSGDSIYIAPTAAHTESVYIPAAAHTDGRNGTSWRTDLQLVNLGWNPVQVQIEQLAQMQGKTEPYIATVTVPAQGALRTVDILAGLHTHEGATALRVTPVDGAVHISSRTYNQVGSSTFGQQVPALTAADALKDDTHGLLVQLAHSPVPDRGYRTNIGLVNAGDSEIEARVTVEVGNIFSGSECCWQETVHVTLPPFAFHQLNNVFKGYQHETRSGYATVNSITPGVQLYAYGSVVDNQTGDPILITPTAFSNWID
jgi:hypothetical protein